MLKKTSWNLISWIIRSKNRLKVLELLETPQMPNWVAKKLKMSLTHASKIIRELNSKKMVVCLNKQEKIGRFYELNTKGRTLFKKIKEMKKV